MNPMLIAAIGGAAIFFFWRQQQARARIDVAPKQLSPSSVPQEWIEMTPEGYSVTGSTSEMYDILT
jgi:hypothetical protein